ncbi:MAG: Rrf2 family transcriptional regulator [Deltaproteobacteria bacterium]|nr:MAG: Rrf2 family transcriptional regulator [Deltaproteobacteria bacterium]
MRLSTRGRYGTRLMVDLAQHYANGPIPLAEIAKRQDLSAKYLEQLIILLKGAGLIRSARGRRGGYMLARSPEDINVGEIIETLIGRLALVNCVTEPELCERSPECPTRGIWVGMTDILKKQLFSMNLQDIVRKSAPLEDLLADSDK